MELIEFLTLNVSDPDNIPRIMSFVFTELERSNRSDFETKNVHVLSGVIDKFVELSILHGIKDTDIIKNETDQFVQAVIESEDVVSSIRRKKCLEIFEKVSSLIIKTYNQIIHEYQKSTAFTEFNLLYNPNLSNKEKAIDLIKEAIDLINSEEQLTRRQKKQIINQLDKALKNLGSSNTDWTSYFGKIYQVILILGAIGSIAGGIGTWTAVKKANEKITQATNIIEQTSINQYYSHKIQISTEISNYYLDNSTRLSHEQTALTSIPALPEKTYEKDTDQ